MDFAKIAQTALLIGSNLPAYIALFEQVKQLFSEEDQQKLQDLLEEAKKKSDEAHEKLQSL